ncbi:MAG: FkbM family methyltransferase [Sulfuritalea sp.]|nr:FkbM family methyltransferase [Sulfuritalea sp.]
MKQLIQSILNRAGYRIERIRRPFDGELIFILDFALYLLNQRRAGAVRFLQVGANDGIQEDPCYAWVNRFPWKGILVEPQPILAAGLRHMYRDRPDIIVEEAVVADRPGALDLYYLQRKEGIPEWASGIASLDYATIATHRSKIPGFDQAIAKARVPALTVAQLLARNGFDSIDFIQIDAEGYDAQILRSIDFRRIRPAVIAYEECNLAFAERAACRTRLSREGYRFATWHGDVLACLPDLLPVAADRRHYRDPVTAGAAVDLCDEKG